MAFHSTKNFNRTVYCIDCLHQHKVTTYELKQGIRCEMCGGNVVKKKELTESQQTELTSHKKTVSKPKSVETNFPPHKLIEQPDGTWKSEPLSFHSSRWPHLSRGSQKNF